MNTPNPEDRRVVRTRRTLRDGLVSLIAEQGWESISVQEICDRANVGRSTFYTHFADKEDLLTSGFDELSTALRQLRSLQPSSKVMAFSRGLLDHAYENQFLFRALAGKRTGEVVLKLFRQLVIDLIGEELDGSFTGARREMTAHYIAGGFVELFSWWIDRRKKATAEEIDAVFQRLTRSVLNAAKARGV